MNTRRETKQEGFTVIELVVVAALLVIAGILVFVQVNNLKVANQDMERKTAINAMYYALEEVYYKQHGSYPATLEPEKLPSVDPALFTDPDGFTLGEPLLREEDVQKIIDEGEADEDTLRQLEALGSNKSPNYHYDAADCDTDGNCKSYTLRADLAREAQYVKKSRHN